MQPQQQDETAQRMEDKGEMSVLELNAYLERVRQHEQDRIDVTMRLRMQREQEQQ